MFIFRPERNFNFMPYLFYNPDKLHNGVVTEYGINTNAKTKPLLISSLIDMVEEFPENFSSQELISQLHTIERSNAGLINSKSYTDLFMAACFAAFTRKVKAYDIMPYIQYSNEEIEKNIINDFTDVINMTQPKKIYNNQTKDTIVYTRNAYGEEIPAVMSIDDDDMLSRKYSQITPSQYDDNMPIVSIGYDDF